MTRWLDPPTVDTSPLSSLSLPPLLKQTLIRRGIQTPDSARAFLHPEATPSTPFPNIDVAVDVIHEAIRNRYRICIWGDFDVDGQTSTALLVQTLRALGADVVYYIPIRGKESHGVHIETLAPIIDSGVKLIVTCDTGITAHEAIDYCNSRGVDVVITDHHELGESLPNAKAVINPKLLPGDHPLKHLAGVGVAYKLAEALLDLRPSNLESPLSNIELLDLVALGLIADVAILKGETRALAQKGIQQLRTANRLGLKAIAELSNTNLESLTEDTIGFTFAPRLNALGRLSDANPAVELLLTNDPARARVLAAQIEGLNAQRRLLTSQVTDAAEAQLREHPELLAEPAIVLAHPNWPGGVVGIVANRLVDRYHKPALLLTESEDGILRGSARSVEGLHITEAISANKDWLLSFGGHPMAAGVSLQKDNLPSFRKGLGRAIEKQLGDIVREEPTLQLDAWLGMDEIHLELANALEQLAPFGAGNPPLKLATRGVILKSAGEIGRTKEHLRLTVEDERGNAQNVLWWGGAGETLPETGAKIDIAYSLRASTFRGQKQVSLTFEELRVTEEKPVELRPIKTEILDHRLQPSSIPHDPSRLVWAEGADKAKGKSRFDLVQAEELVIYTTPPSPAYLRLALELVKPGKVYVAGVSPSPAKTDEFLSQLAGMAKYAINNKGGKASVRELAVVTAQREGAVRIGLEWLAAGGHVSVSGENDAVLLSAGNGEVNQYLQKELFTAVRGILEETAAYRVYFSTAPVDSLFREG
ncbi:MAG TPA: single-stranded-DNA-specific exonuclease RecJ [Anaerolineales bacterium]|nr:single-stranded-DNA-specific exonuclease RecJ [Anaerolineales bacterium]